MKFLDDFVAYHKDFTGCPETFVRWSGLYALSCVAGTHHVLRTGNWDHRPVLWMLLVGESTVYKSVAMRTARQLIDDIDSKIKAANFYSHAAFITDLAEQPHRAFFYDEAESYLKMMSEKFNQGFRSDMMTLWSGNEVIRKRIQGKEGHGENHITALLDYEGKIIDLPYVCWSGASTPYQIGHHLNGSTVDMLSGFFPRILLIPQGDKGISIPRPPPDDKQKYALLLNRLSELHQIRACEYTWSNSAGNIHDDWYQRITERANKADEILKPFFMRLRENYISRLCIIHAFERGASIIEDEDVTNSIQWLWSIEKGWPDIIGQFTSSETSRSSDRIVNYIKDHSPCSRTDLLRAFRSLKGEEMNRILWTALQNDLITEKPESTSGRNKKLLRYNA